MPAPETIEARIDQVLPEERTWPAETRERCRVAFVSGASNMAQLAVIEGIPYGTLARWSAEERWGEMKGKVKATVVQSTVRKVSEELESLRQEQVRTVMRRAAATRDVIDKAKGEDNPEVQQMRSRSAQSIAMAEATVDDSIRAHLGMDQEQSSSGAGITLNVLGTVVLPGERHEFDRSG